MLAETYTALLSKYTEDKNLIAKFWNEIETAYSAKKRHYHTLHHLANLLQQLSTVKDQIKSWDVILFTLYYHDIVYNALKSDNEEQSTVLASARMKQISIPGQTIEQCKEQILATKKHLPSTDSDTNYFTDADLSVLGADWGTYLNYYKNIRKEYAIYPSIIYNPGRKKVLLYFLEMERIFKTDYFYSKLEKQAKQNLQKEFDLLK